MSDAMVPVDAEALVVEYLAARMPGYDVSTRLRDQSGAITIEQVGGVRRSPVHDHPLIVVQTWHDDEVEASQMCRLAFAHLWALHEDSEFGNRVRQVTSVGGPQSFPDPTAANPRWQATVELNLRPIPIGA